MDECCYEENEDAWKAQSLKNISIEGLLEVFTREVENATKESVFYQKKIELLQIAIQKLKS